MRLVVIGGVAAGLAAAARAKRLDFSIEAIVLEKNAHISWAACGLPYYVEGQVKSLKELVLNTPEKFRAERMIDVRVSNEVMAISHPRREVVMRNGDRVAYDRLIIATGARVDTVGIEGGTDANVFKLATLEDAQRMKAFLDTQKPRTAAIIGGGYIGLEAAEALRSHGVDVAIYVASQYLLGRDDPSLTERVKKHLERCGVKVRFGARVRNARDLGAEMVVLAAGFKPNVELAQEAGIEIGLSGAIRVNDQLETNLYGVYAAGDCAETTHLVTGKPVWIPLGSTANKMGRIAGACVLGRRERFPGVTGTSIVRVCGMGVAVTGLSEAEARKAGFEAVSASIDARDRAKYFRSRPTWVQLVADRRSGRILGGAVVADYEAAGRINVIATAVTSKMRLDDFALLDMAYSPPYAPVWDPVLVAAQQLQKALE